MPASPVQAPAAAPDAPKKMSTTAIVVLVILGVQLGPALVFVPVMLLIFLLDGSADGDGPDLLQGQLAFLAVLAMTLAAAFFALRNADPVTPGRPAGPRRLPYDLRGPGGLGQRLRHLPDSLQSLHRGILWGLVVVVGLCAVGILAAVVAGPEGPVAALWGFLLLAGWMLTLFAYAAAGYRFLVPTGVGLLAYGLLLHGDAVARSWGASLPGPVHAIGLLALFWLALAPCIEARARTHRPAWGIAATVAGLLAAAFPLVHLAGIDDDAVVRVAVGLSSAGILVGLSGTLAFLRVGPGWRVAAAIVTGLWIASSIAASLVDQDLRERLMAATVLVVLVTAIAVLTAFLVQRPRATA